MSEKLDLFRTRYRIVRDRFAGYEVQWRYWWMPFYVQGSVNTHFTIESARKYLDLIKGAPVHQECTMSEKLKPCPWCGTTEHLSSVRIGSQVDGFTPIAVRCHHVDCDDVQGPTGNGFSEAVNLWNRRHQDQSNPSEFERMLSK